MKAPLFFLNKQNIVLVYQVNQSQAALPQNQFLISKPTAELLRQLGIITNNGYYIGHRMISRPFLSKHKPLIIEIPAAAVGCSTAFAPNHHRSCCPPLLTSSVCG